MKLPKILGVSALSWTIVFWISCVAVPLASVVSYGILGVHKQGKWSLLVDPAILYVVRATLWQAGWSTLLSAAFGLVLGIVFGSFLISHPLSRIPALLSVPFGVPTVVSATAWIVWLGRSGILSQTGIPLDWNYSLKAVVLAHAFLNIPLVALVVSQAMQNIPKNQAEAARTLGASKFYEFLFVVWPQIRWAFASACAQVMSLCTMSFALVLVLGGGPPVETLETEIFGRMRFGSLDLLGATVCGVWEIILSLLPWLLVLVFRKKQPGLIPKRSRWITPPSGKKWTQRGLVAVAFLFILPYAAVLNKQALTIASDPAWREQIEGPLLISFQLALCSGVAAVFTAVMAICSLVLLKRESWLRTFANTLLVLPSGVSVLVLSLGVWLAYGKWMDPFEGSLVAMILLQMTLFFPVAFRILWPSAQGVQLPQLETAVSLGASPVQAFLQIEMVRWRGPLFAAFAGVVGASLGEVGAVSLFASEKLVPLPLLISRWMQQYHFEEAQGLAGLLFFLSFFLIVGSFEFGNRLSTPYASIEFEK